MDLTDKYYELKKQYCVIARARLPDAAQFEAQRIIGGLVNHLGPYITSSDILYNAPSFIIHVNTAYAQRNILSQRTFQTAGFSLDVLPWSEEHEKTQFPWMPAQAGLQRKIEIDPMMILPVPFSGDVHKARVGPACYPTAIDLSYLIIADIKDYYYNKHALFCTCKAKAAEMAAVTGLYTTQIIADVNNLCENLQILRSTGIHHIQATLRTILTSLEGIANSTTTNSNTVFEDMTSVSEGPDSIVNFDCYKKLPPLTTMPIPEDYVNCLRVIHAQAAREAYGLESFFTTAQTADGKYEAFRTMGLITEKYIEQPLDTSAAIEAAAIYHSLKAITNWMGYSIVDINYPSLANLMAALQRLDAQMVLMQCIAYSASEHSNQLYAYLSELHEQCSSIQDVVTGNTYVTESIQRFSATIHRYYHTIIRLSNGFVVAKANYFAEHLDIPSPTTQPKQWLTLQPENEAYVLPQQE